MKQFSENNTTPKWMFVVCVLMPALALMTHCLLWLLGFKIF